MFANMNIISEKPISNKKVFFNYSNFYKFMF